MRLKKKHLPIIATTCVVGFGVWFGLFITSGVYTLFGEGYPNLFVTLSVLARIVGVFAALVWVFRRIRVLPVRIYEQALFLFASLSLCCFCYIYISEEVTDFLAIDPLVAVQRVADRNGIHGDTFTFMGTTRMGVHVYAVKQGGEARWVIGVAPRYRLWWTQAFNMDREYYESHDIDKPPPAAK